jgi:RIMS-binding protein 2
MTKGTLKTNKSTVIHHNNASFVIFELNREQYYQNEKQVEPRIKHVSGGDQRAYRGRNSDPRQTAYQKTPRDKRPRWVVAIYDYDPTTMSPNPDVCDEELPFKEGEHIKV